MHSRGGEAGMTVIDFGTDWPAKRCKMLESGPTGPLKLQAASRWIAPSPLAQAEVPAGYIQAEDRERILWTGE